MLNAAVMRGRVADGISVGRFAQAGLTRRDSWEVTMLGARVIPAIPVRDLDRSKRFYGETLGLEPVAVDVPASQLYACGAGSYLVIYQADGTRPEQHVATFLVEAIAEEVAALRERGVTFEEYDLPELKTVGGIATVGPIQGAWFKDPDSNVIGVVHLSASI